jgi:flagellar M-ring protein FliF
MLQGLLQTIRTLGMVRVAVIGALALGTLGGLAVLEFYGAAAPRMAVLASSLEPQDSQDLMRALDTAHLRYKFDPQTRKIMVAEADLEAAKALKPELSSAAAGGANAAEPGYEIFDNNGMLLSDFEQQIKLTRALEGELSRTISSMKGILRARVHIVLPHRQPFERQKTEAQASVMLTLASRGTMSDEAVHSVVDLVASSVPGLKPNAITVVDSNLHLLVQAGNDDQRMNGARSEDLRQHMESRLSQGVELMLERSLGIGHVHAEASVQLNFDKVNETQERFDPDSTAVRSTQAVTSNSKTSEKTQGVSVQNNLPNADAGGPASGSTEAKQEETTNYEITKNVREIVHDQPNIERMTLAVMVDGVDTVDANGKHSWQPRSQAEMDQITRLVKTAVGFDEKRGDKLEIACMPFTNAMEVPDTAPASPVAVPALRNNELASFIQLVAFGAIGLITIVMTARSIFAHLSEPPASFIVKSPEPAFLAAGHSQLALEAAGAGQAAGGGRQLLLGAPSVDPEEEFQEVFESPKARKVREMIEKDPTLAARVIEQMLHEESD